MFGLKCISYLLLYRFPEALLNTMTKTFILRPNSQGGLGLSPQEYASVSAQVLIYHFRRDAAFQFCKVFEEVRTARTEWLPLMMKS